MSEQTTFWRCTCGRVVCACPRIYLRREELKYEYALGPDGRMRAVGLVGGGYPRKAAEEQEQAKP